MEKVLFSSTSESTDRGQNEPTAALFAVSFMVVGLLLFAGYHYDVVNNPSDRAVDRPALGLVYEHTTESGRFDPTAPLHSTLDPSHLPRGQNIYITVTYRDSSGEHVLVDEAFFDRDGEYQGPNPEYSLPPDAQDSSRPLVIEQSTGRTHGGRLHITVWG